MRPAAQLAALLSLALGAQPLVAQSPAAGDAIAQSSIAPAAAWALPEREEMIAVEGGRVWTSVNGDLAAKAPPVVFVHGGPGGTHAEFGAMTALANTRAVVLYDQLDSGMSDQPNDPKNWRVARFVSELEAIRKALKIERWHVVGHSWGSAIALEYAAAHPDRVVSTVLAGTYISTPHWIMGTNLLVRDLPAAVQRDIAACEAAAPRPPEATCRAAEDVFYGEYNGRADTPVRSSEQNAYRDRTKGRGNNGKLYNTMWGPSEFTARGSLLTYDGTPLLRKIDGKRTLFLIGQYDEAPIDTVRDFARLTPGSELAVVPGGSHGAFDERPIEMEGLIRGWLARKDPR